MKENYCVKEKQNKILGETTDKSEKKLYKTNQTKHATMWEPKYRSYHFNIFNFFEKNF